MDLSSGWCGKTFMLCKCYLLWSLKLWLILWGHVVVFAYCDCEWVLCTYESEWSEYLHMSTNGLLMNNGRSRLSVILGQFSSFLTSGPRVSNAVVVFSTWSGGWGGHPFLWLIQIFSLHLLVGWTGSPFKHPSMGSWCGLWPSQGGNGGQESANMVKFGGCSSSAFGFVWYWRL